MSEFWKITLVIFYLPIQMLMADNINQVADQIINSSMLKTAQPCNDFYAYACGNYHKSNISSSSAQPKHILDYANHHYNKAIINLLDKYEQRQYLVEKGCYAITEKVKNYFKSCRKVIQRNLTRYLQEVKPGPLLNWPGLENESSENGPWPYHKNFDVFYLLGKFRSFGIKNIILTAYDPYLTMERSSWIVQPATAYLPNATLMLQLLSSIGIKNTTNVLADILETDKAVLAMVKKNTRHKVILQTNFGDLVKRYPNLNFEAYFMEYVGQQLPLNTPVNIRDLDYFQNLNDNMWLLFDKRKLSNYLMMRYLLFFHTTTPSSDMSCMAELRETFNLALNFLYYHYNSEFHENFVKPDVINIFNTVVDMLAKQLQSDDLQLTVQQIELIRRKLSGVRLNVGNLPHHASCATVEQIYASVPHLDENNYYKNKLLRNRFVQRERLKADTRAILDSYELANPPAVVYKPHQQLIALNYNYLMPPVYDVHYNNLGKYGLLGFILAQQLVRYCNLMELNDKENKPISKPLQAAFECLKIDPSVYGIPERRIEDNVASEVIRKIVTLKFFNLQSLETVRSWKQYFFLHVAQHCCNSVNQAGAYIDKASDRLNRIVMNLEDFSHTFNCPKGSHMNPSEKCQIQ